MKNHEVIQKIVQNSSSVFNNLSTEELMNKAVERGEGKITDTGALAADTGKYTGRSPKDKFIVKDSVTEDTVWWGPVNNPISEQHFDGLLDKIIKHYESKDVFIRNCAACADDRFKLNIQVVTEGAYQNLFAKHLFIRPSSEDLSSSETEWVILAAPTFSADPSVDGTRQENFTIVNFKKKMILIGGSGYTGEIKKGIFGVLNYILPQEKNVLSMHCSANIGKDNDTTIFFGLSGTGKTTLSADPERGLIGDDEHGWAEDSVFNFEGGCYAKCIDLTEEKEPQIWRAIKRGALVENVRFYGDSDQVDYTNVSVTENTRVAYPLENIDNAVKPSVGPAPNDIFFLTCDAFGVLPPIAKLTNEQAMYHFISGYTAKVAGTEAGVTEPEATFSACFGEAFLALHPGKYAEMLGQKLAANPDVNVWLINTGWSGGSYGVGSRMSLKYTRAMIKAAMNGDLDHVDYVSHKVFGLSYPTSCPDVPSGLLDARSTWANENEYDLTANKLADLFDVNFKKFSNGVSEEIIAAAPIAQ